MSRHPRNGVGRLVIALAVLLAVVAAGFGNLANARAQDASPTATECVSPGLPPGTPTPMDDMEGMDMGSPEAMDDMDMGTPAAMDDTEMGSPEAEDMMMPEATPLPEGMEADEETAAAIVMALENYAACYNEGQASGDPSLYIALETENYWMAEGYTNVYDVVADEMGSPFPSVTLLNVDNPMTYDDGRVSGDISVMYGDHWYQDLRVFLSQDGDTWKWDADAPLRPEPDVEQVSVIQVVMSESVDEATGEPSYSFDIPLAASIQTAEALVFNVTNNAASEELHEALLVQLPEGADPLGLLDGSIPFDQVRFLGGVFGIPPGETQDLVMLNLEPGTYHMVCFFPSPDGVPHAARGMVAELTIVAPAEG